jgi:hypothetical protein
VKVFSAEIKHGDCLEVLKEYPDNTFDLIVTSPPYADRRKNTYGGVLPEKYVEWFLPRSKQFLRVLKPTGTFILMIIFIQRLSSRLDIKPKNATRNFRLNTEKSLIVLRLNSLKFFAKLTEQFFGASWFSSILAASSIKLVSVGSASGHCNRLCEACRSSRDRPSSAYRA